VAARVTHQGAHGPRLAGHRRRGGGQPDVGPHRPTGPGPVPLSVPVGMMEP
jgi:hypothetical protein